LRHDDGREVHGEGVVVDFVSLQPISGAAPRKNQAIQSVNSLIPAITQCRLREGQPPGIEKRRL
jgi:hypothetical protein